MKGKVRDLRVKWREIELLIGNGSDQARPHIPPLYNLLLSPTNIINNTTNPITNKLKPMITPTNKITCLAFNSVMSSVESNSLNNDLLDLLIIPIKTTINTTITICI